MSVLLQTSKGQIVIDLYTEEAPLESKNFIKLCKAQYYTFSPFYNLQKDLFIEFGDPNYPLSNEGRSAWGLAGGFKAFKTSRNKLPQNKKGAISIFSMESREGPNDLFATSLCFITLKDVEDKVVFKNGITFGQITEGLEILDVLNDVPISENYDPLQDLRIHYTYILKDPFEDINGLAIPISPPRPTEQQLDSIKLDANEELDLEEKELTEEQIKEKKARDAETKALTLEIMGDLPSAEAKPMENVLFVCKLNPLTTSDDLKIIFSRFGKILSCEVICDKQTGDSLQYAFIEYEEKRSCEAAYFKMDNTLIDERRIHVDFSQSVSKLVEKWRPNFKTSKRSGKRDESPERSSKDAFRERDTLKANSEGTFEVNYNHSRTRREYGHKQGSRYLESTRHLDPRNSRPNFR